MKNPATAKATGLEAPQLGLRACSVEEHCRALIAVRRLPFWWYQGVCRLSGNYSLPFQDRAGTWWYQVKPGLCWPADFFQPLRHGTTRIPLRRSYLGYQHIVPEDGEANSHLVINTVHDLGGYGPTHIESKRRTKVRSGLRSCLLETLDSFHKETVDGCRAAWDDLTNRTGWKGSVSEQWFDDTWRTLLDVPGVSIIVARDRISGRVGGFHLTKILGDTAYGDAVASHSELFHCRVNDAMIYGFLIAAGRLPGVTKGHYAIKSYVRSLESFKRSMGFVAHPFPAFTFLRPPVGMGLRLLRPASYRRMIGRFPSGPEDGGPGDEAEAVGET
ncbi:MAG: hypothetical protein MUE60_08015 [Candidatus Eisenbacteria bacterium]|jgi:hypothetical protein|nr:hypothetical protein [Candidatus Eisenbacteria bacterium]